MELVQDEPQDKIRVGGERDAKRLWAIRVAVVAALLLVGAIVFRVLQSDDSTAAPESAVEVRGALADIIVHFEIDPTDERMKSLIGEVALVPGVAAAEFSPASVITGIAPGAETLPIGEAVIGVRIEDGADMSNVIALLENILDVERAEVRK